MAEGALRFETETCSRCGGCGEYSYCEMYGRTCFKCRGKGIQLTKRGYAAWRWMEAQKMIKAADVKPGMRVKIVGVGTFTVTKSEKSDTKSASTKNEAGEWIWEEKHWFIGGAPEWAGIHTFPEADIQNIGSNAEQIELMRQAIEYQNSLTKEGKPRKRAAAINQENASCS